MSLSKLDVIRLNIGDTSSTCDLTDEQIMYAIGLFPLPTYSDALQTWNATIQCLIWLKGKYAATGQSSKEKVGSVEVDSNGYERYKSICDLLDYWKANPPSVSGSDTIIAGFRFAADQSPRISMGWRDDCLPPEQEDDDTSGLF